MILSISAQNVLGKWKTINEETVNIESIVEVYLEDEIIYGKILTLLEAESKGRLCDKCVGEEKNKPLEGLVVIKRTT